MRKIKKTKYSTIIVLNKENDQTEIYNIKDYHIRNFSKYKYLFLGFVLLMMITIGALVNVINSHELEKTSLVGQISMLEIEMENDDSQRKLEELNIAEESLIKIEKYLTDKGIEVLQYSSTPNNNKADENTVGGEYYPVDDNSLEVAEYKKERIKKILFGITNIPLGYPHIGRLTSKFGVRSNPFTGQGFEGHSGLDFAGKTGSPISATANGKVVHASVRGGYGNCVIIKHKFGYQTLYGHLSKIDVKVGQKVKSGDVIGKLGSTGRSSGPHLHYEVIKNDKKTNPVQYLSL